MLFNTGTFLFFFLAFYVVYWLLNNWSLKARNIVILLSSYVFYGFWDIRFLGLIILSSTIDFFVARKLEEVNTLKLKKLLLAVSIVINLGLLAFFKYYNFFVQELIDLMQHTPIDIGLKTLNIILPVGISFYTFQTMSYAIDVYRGDLKAERNFLNFFAYVAFFPQLVAGPIERARNMLPQFREEKKFNQKQSSEGIGLIIWGLFKKIVIADNCGVMVDHLLNPQYTFGGVEVLVGITLFAIQIYGDFSGYSDIALGLGKTLGFELSINFKVPYFSRSLREFWQRWHITLSQWFRDYVYIPLGGSRGTRERNVINLLVTLLLSGLWHGSNGTFAVWGLLHGLGLTVERYITFTPKTIIRQGVVLVTVILFWLPFRAENMSHLAQMVSQVFDWSSYHGNLLDNLVAVIPFKRLIVVLFLIVFFFAVEYRLREITFANWLNLRSRRQRISLYYVLVLAIIFVGAYNVKPSFIYFQF